MEANSIFWRILRFMGFWRYTLHTNEFETFTVYYFWSNLLKRKFDLFKIRHSSRKMKLRSFHDFYQDRELFDRIYPFFAKKIADDHKKIEEE